MGDVEGPEEIKQLVTVKGQSRGDTEEMAVSPWDATAKAGHEIQGEGAVPSWHPSQGQGRRDAVWKIL